MDISAQTIRTAEFTTVKKGYDPDEVDAFRDEVAAAFETAQSQAAAMESRARAAVARLQEVSQQAGVVAREGGTPSGGVVVAPSSGDTEVISRTLLLAQRTADSTVAEARAEAQAVTSSAREEASRVVDDARALTTKMVDEARVEARRSKEEELARAENEVQALLARRDFLLADVDQLEQYIQAQRERLRETAVELHDIVDRVPGGLGDMRRPLMSASAEPEASSVAHTAEVAATPAPQPVAVVAPSPSPAPVPEPFEPFVITPVDADAEDDDPMSLFATSAPAPRAFPEVQRDDPWSGFDAESVPTGQVPITTAVPRAYADEVTAEVPITKPKATPNDPFRIGGDELR
ncbi:MAG: DivIVA domain-containing protein [Actinomycetota bacterium]|nr:DivIVA domain-containing protein [Actinomycetota bacterium]